MAVTFRPSSRHYYISVVVFYEILKKVSCTTYYAVCPLETADLRLFSLPPCSLLPSPRPMPYALMPPSFLPLPLHLNQPYGLIPSQSALALISVFHKEGLDQIVKLLSTA
jgi:hypothetical protein